MGTARIPIDSNLFSSRSTLAQNKVVLLSLLPIAFGRDLRDSRVYEIFRIHHNLSYKYGQKKYDESNIINHMLILG